MSRAAVGLRAHSGWAAAVTVGGEATAPVLPETKLKHRLGALGRAAGPPWAEDQKLAALAAWIALASGNKRGFPGHP